ncbi:MAG: DNA polymerase III subunit gamma/tau [Opitutae bacterium]|nr:DNA polymerase III subunit gamma/tau [Opitutae bacterium]
MEQEISLVGTPAVAVLEQAIARSRLSHSLLLHGDDLGTLVGVGHAIADRLLASGAFVGAGLPTDESDNESRRKAAPTVNRPQQYFPPEGHPDFFTLRPAGKARFITADATRDLIGQVQVSPQISQSKVAVVFEADRMNAAAANIFLKTLEEPSRSTTILLLTTRPYALLPTIRSRCLHFRFPAAAVPLAHPDLAGWLADYQAWLGQLAEGVSEKAAVADRVMALYGLVTRFNAILSAATDEVWKAQKEKLAPDLAKDEQEAIETGIAVGLRHKLFVSLEHATRAFALAATKGRDPEHTRAVDRSLVAAIERLEHSAGLLRLNLNEAAALEDFLLSSLRLWSRR